MTRSDLILQERHRDDLRDLMGNEAGEERAAYMLFGRSEIGSDPWDRKRRCRYTSYEVIPVPDDDYVSASEQHVTWATGSFVKLCKRADEEGLVPGIVHSHPGGLDRFSLQDDSNEHDLYTLLRNRNGGDVEMVSVVQAGESVYRGRVWAGDETPSLCQRVTIVGTGLRMHDVTRNDAAPTLTRQALAFGEDVNTWLRQLTIGVVGCGGTGSAVVQLLTRLGVGRMVVIDEDTVEVSNLNRLHGATMEDARNKASKAHTVSAHVATLGLGVDVRSIKGWVDTPEARDALKSCDVIFGCTDDHSGRIFLNRLSQFYLIPVIDVGLALLPRDDGEPGLKEMAARTTVLAPGKPCLICRGVADPNRAREEDLERNDPEEFERQKTEAYVIGADNPAPAVVTFTTEAATMAVNELLQGLVDYRGEGAWASSRYRRLDVVEERRQGVRPEENCALCGSSSNWGRGDVDPFLDRAG